MSCALHKVGASSLVLGLKSYLCLHVHEVQAKSGARISASALLSALLPRLQLLHLRLIQLLLKTDPCTAHEETFRVSLALSLPSLIGFRTPASQPLLHYRWTAAGAIGNVFLGTFRSCKLRPTNSPIIIAIQ